MSSIEMLIKRNVDGELISFIEKYIKDFSMLDVIRFFGLNLHSRVDMETLREVTGDKEEEIERTVKTLIDEHIISEVDNRYEIIPDKKIKENIKKFADYYKIASVRPMIVSYVLEKEYQNKGYVNEKKIRQKGENNERA